MKNLYGLGDGEYRVKVEIEFQWQTPPNDTPQAIERDQLNIRLQDKAMRLAEALENKLNLEDTHVGGESAEYFGAIDLILTKQTAAQLAAVLMEITSRS